MEKWIEPFHLGNFCIAFCLHFFFLGDFNARKRVSLCANNLAFWHQFATLINILTSSFFPSIFNCKLAWFLAWQYFNQRAERVEENCIVFDGTVSLFGYYLICTILKQIVLSFALRRFRRNALRSDTLAASKCFQLKTGSSLTAF